MQLEQIQELEESTKSRESEHLLSGILSNLFLKTSDHHTNNDNYYLLRSYPVPGQALYMGFICNLPHGKCSYSVVVIFQMRNLRFRELAKSTQQVSGECHTVCPPVCLLNQTVSQYMLQRGIHVMAIQSTF